MSRANSSISLVDRFPPLRKLEGESASRPIPFIQQLTGTECGAACLAMVLAHYDKHVQVSEIREVMGLNCDGASALSLLKAGRWYGLRGRGIKLELESLPYLAKGAILHWNFSHFVVFEKLSKNGVHVVDPAFGRRCVPMKEFGLSFTGVALVFERAADFQPVADERRLVWTYVKYFIRQPGFISRITVTSILLQLLALAVPVMTGTLVDRVIPHRDHGLLVVLGIGLIAIVVFHPLASLVRSHLLLGMRTQMDAEMTLGFIEHLVSLPYAFFQERSEGDLMMRVNSNAIIREMLTSGMLSGLLDGGLVGLYLIILMLTDPAMGGVVIGLALLQCVIFLLSYRRYQEMMGQDLHAQSRSQSHLAQMLEGIETLKAGGVEDRAVEQWSNLFVDGLNVSLRRGRLSAVVDSLMNGMRIGGPLLVMWFGGLQVLGGRLSLGAMLAMNALAAGFLIPASTLVSTGLQLQLLRSYIERIDDVLKAPPEQDKSKVARAGRLSGRIEMDRVSFSYGSRASTGVTNVSVEIAAGQKVAIVGQSGAGKSTLAKLILGLYQPSSGRILYDGLDLAGLDLASVRNQFGIVTQRSYIFAGPIQRNIALKDPSTSMTQVVEAAKLACVHDEIIEMPMGYETILNDGGRSISGGQRQRLALARALLHHPAILLLDEATSELDAVTESQVHGNLAALRCTRIVIAHRLSTVADADLIFVVENGELTERGTHSELMARSGKYAELVLAQVVQQ